MRRIGGRKGRKEKDIKRGTGIEGRKDRKGRTKRKEGNDRKGRMEGR